MQDISVELQAQLGARDLAIQGLMRDKGLAEDHNRVRACAGEHPLRGGQMHDRGLVVDQHGVHDHVNM